ncbi:MAG TPA: hypothetical protein VHN14_22480 [Kofleriaceae bacterium]|nr:hypothetical protein [Kofleriaceae bacterium]
MSTSPRRAALLSPEARRASIIATTPAAEVVAAVLDGIRVRPALDVLAVEGETSC